MGLLAKVSLLIASGVISSAAGFFFFFLTVFSPQVDLMHSCYLILCYQCYQSTVTSHLQLNQIKKQLYHQLIQAWMILR